MRVRPSPTLTNRLSKFYGNDCVLCDKWKAELHHNDEDSARTVFENLIPLCPTCNKLIEQQEISPLRGDVSTAAIAAKAFQHFSDDNFPQSYACSRLGSRLSETRERNKERAIKFLIDSLTALRQIGQLHLVRDVVFDLERLFAATSDVQPLLRADLLARIGCVLYDFGSPKLAKPFVLAALKRYGQKSPHLNSAEIAIARSRAYKHVAMVLTAESRDRKSTAYARHLLKDAEAFGQDYNNGQAISSALLVQAYQARRDLNWDSVESLARDGLRFEDQNDCLSNAMWYFLLGTYWEHRRKQPDRAISYYDEAYKQFHNSHLMCQPMAISGGTEIADPARALARLRVSRTSLLLQQQHAFSEAELKRLYRIGMDL